MLTRALSQDDRLALEELLRRVPAYNAFHLSALREQGMMGPGREDGAWAVGAYKEARRGDGLTAEGELAGVVVASRGTGGLYYSPGDSETLQALSEVVQGKGKAGRLSLLSGHASQIDPLLPFLRTVEVGPVDRCYFYTRDQFVNSRPFVALDPRPPTPWSPRLATTADMERLIDFYEVGFYSLARLPTRAAWRYRLSEQIAYRTMFLIEEPSGKIVSAAQTSAEAQGVAMLGGVATLPEYRGKGLSTLCVGALCDHLFGKGITSISLFYLKDNDPAGRVYQKLGFQDAGEWLLVSLGFPILVAQGAPRF